MRKFAGVRYGRAETRLQGATRYLEKGADSPGGNSGYQLVEGSGHVEPLVRYFFLLGKLRS